MKDKISDWKTNNLVRQITQLRKDNAKLEQQLAELQAGRMTEIMETIRNDPATNTGDDNIKKYIYEKTPDELYKGETSQNETRSEGTPKKKKSKSETKESCVKQVQPTHIINKRPRKMSRKRCHFCRKRGHIQRDCPSRQMLQKWLWDDANEMYQNTLQNCKAWRLPIDHCI